MDNNEEDLKKAELRGRPIRSAEETEKELFEEGSKLTGAALKNFLSSKLLRFEECDSDDNDDGSDLS
jgi:hypothetical protein